MNSKKLMLIIFVTSVMIAGIGTLFLFKSPTNVVLAQEDSSKDKISNHEIEQEASQDQNSEDITATAYGSVSKSLIDSQSSALGIEVIPIGAFRNDGDNVDGWFNLFVEGYIRNDSSEPACFMAPTYPPVGATLTEFRISILDQNATFDLFFVQLKRVNLTTGVVDVVAGGDGSIPWNDTNATELFANISPGTETVSNLHAYYVNLCFPGNTGTDVLFYGARLFYNSQ